MADCADAVLARAIVEPDGFSGWPKENGAANFANMGLFTDNMLGEAMLLQPLVLAARAILADEKLRAAYGAKASVWLTTSEMIFAKWDARGAWRPVKDGGVWIVPDFGLNENRTGWTEGYANRLSNGFTMQANKQNAISLWLLALHRATGKIVYRERAQAWWAVMKTRLRPGARSGALVWNYWSPAGPWDYKSPDMSHRTLKHWVGVHPNGVYYAIDVAAMVEAYESGLGFSADIIGRLAATNRRMWNGELRAARFAAIDGAAADQRWKDTPGVLWEALAPYDPVLRDVFEANFDPAGWTGLWVTPWWLERLANLGKPSPLGPAAR